MKTPHTTEAVQSANKQARFIGGYPKSLGSVNAAVLARLLEGERLTSLSQVFESSTTRLASAIHNLGSKHKWMIERQPIAIGTNDGRVTDVTEYWLSDTTRMQAREHGSDEFCEAVWVAREEQRKTASDKREQAGMRNATRAMLRTGYQGEAQ